MLKEAAEKAANLWESEFHQRIRKPFTWPCKAFDPKEDEGQQRKIGGTLANCLARSHGTWDWRQFHIDIDWCAYAHTDQGKQTQPYLFETSHMCPEESIDGESGQGWDGGRRHWASQSDPSWHFERLDPQVFWLIDQAQSSMSGFSISSNVCRGSTMISFTVWFSTWWNRTM